MFPQKKGRSWGWAASHAIKDKAFEKLFALKEPRYAALLLVEFLLTMLIVAGIVLYIDGRFNQLQTPLNIFAFAGICFAAIHFYNYTSAFRKSRKNGIQRTSSIKTLALEFILFLIIAVSAFVYYDPKINTLPYPYNIVFFLAILAVPLYFYINEKFLKAAY